MIDILACLLIGWIVTAAATSMAGGRSFNLLVSTGTTLGVAGFVFLIAFIV
jgi:hypothetical protein